MVTTTRRAFAAMLLAVPVAASGTSATAQTPYATLASGTGVDFASDVLAMEPDDVLAALLSRPFSAPRVMTQAAFFPQPLEDIDEVPFANDALGGVNIRREEGEGDPEERNLGVYLVFPSPEQASTAIATYLDMEVTGGASGQTPLSLAGLGGVTISYPDAGARAVLQAGNVVIFSTDIILEDGTRADPETGVIRSTYAMLALLDHLREITRA